MFCTKCGVELRNDVDPYCSRCGARTSVEIDVPASPARPLMLDKANKKVAGVCAGFARYLEVDVTLVRVIWLALTVTTGVGLLAYIAAWLIMPAERPVETRVHAVPYPQAG